MKVVFKGVGYFVMVLGITIVAVSILKPKIYAFAKEALFQSMNKKFVLESSYKEHNRYTLEVYRQINNNSFTGLSSSAGFAQAYVVLKDKQGKVLLEPKWYASCDFIIGDLDVGWNVNRVYFTKFNYIDLTTMSFDCY